ncbi:conserved Plasmodium protein, unknown function [Plasmodium sp. DRC-Itaito]|nr:conserved Plasmodium protein, unknown function [Plasmodium sp. DRC-Itaito]
MKSFLFKNINKYDQEYKNKYKYLDIGNECYKNKCLFLHLRNNISIYTKKIKVEIGNVHKSKVFYNTYHNNLCRSKNIIKVDHIYNNKRVLFSSYNKLYNRNITKDIRGCKKSELIKRKNILLLKGKDREKRIFNLIDYALKGNITKPCNCVFNNKDKYMGECKCDSKNNININNYYINSNNIQYNKCAEKNIFSVNINKHYINNYYHIFYHNPYKMRTMLFSNFAQAAISLKKEKCIKFSKLNLSDLLIFINKNLLEDDVSIKTWNNLFVQLDKVISKKTKNEEQKVEISTFFDDLTNYECYVLIDNLKDIEEGVKNNICDSIFFECFVNSLKNRDITFWYERKVLENCGNEENKKKLENCNYNNNKKNDDGYDDTNVMIKNENIENKRNESKIKSYIKKNIKGFLNISSSEKNNNIYHNNNNNNNNNKNDNVEKSKDDLMKTYIKDNINKNDENDKINDKLRICSNNNIKDVKMIKKWFNLISYFHNKCEYIIIIKEYLNKIFRQNIDELIGINYFSKTVHYLTNQINSKSIHAIIYTYENKLELMKSYDFSYSLIILLRFLILNHNLFNKIIDYAIDDPLKKFEESKYFIRFIKSIDTYPLIYPNNIIYNNTELFQKNMNDLYNFTFTIFIKKLSMRLNDYNISNLLFISECLSEVIFIPNTQNNILHIFINKLRYHINNSIDILSVDNYMLVRLFKISSIFSFVPEKEIYIIKSIRNNKDKNFMKSKEFMHHMNSKQYVNTPTLVKDYRNYLRSNRRTGRHTIAVMNTNYVKMENIYNSNKEKNDIYFMDDIQNDDLIYDIKEEKDKLHKYHHTNEQQKCISNIHNNNIHNNNINNNNINYNNINLENNNANEKYVISKNKAQTYINNTKNKISALLCSKANDIDKEEELDELKNVNNNINYNINKSCEKNDIYYNDKENNIDSSKINKNKKILKHTDEHNVKEQIISNEPNKKKNLSFNLQNDKVINYYYEGSELSEECQGNKSDINSCVTQYDLLQVKDDKICDLTNYLINYNMNQDVNKKYKKNKFLLKNIVLLLCSQIDKKLEDMINEMENKKINFFIEKKNQNKKKYIPMTKEQLIQEIKYINEMNNEKKNINNNNEYINMNKDKNNNISNYNNNNKMQELYKHSLIFYDISVLSDIVKFSHFSINTNKHTYELIKCIKKRLEEIMNFYYIKSNKHEDENILHITKRINNINDNKKKNVNSNDNLKNYIDTKEVTYYKGKNINDETQKNKNNASTPYNISNMFNKNNTNIDIIKYKDNTYNTNNTYNTYNTNGHYVDDIMLQNITTFKLYNFYCACRNFSPSFLFAFSDILLKLTPKINVIDTEKNVDLFNKKYIQKIEHVKTFERIRNKNITIPFIVSLLHSLKIMISSNLFLTNNLLNMHISTMVQYAYYVLFYYYYNKYMKICPTDKIYHKESEKEVKSCEKLSLRDNITNMLRKKKEKDQNNINNVNNKVHSNEDSYNTTKYIDTMHNKIQLDNNNITMKEEVLDNINAIDKNNEHLEKLSKSVDLLKSKNECLMYDSDDENGNNNNNNDNIINNNNNNVHNNHNNCDNILKSPNDEEGSAISSIIKLNKKKNKRLVIFEDLTLDDLCNIYLCLCSSLYFLNRAEEKTNEIKHLIYLEHKFLKLITKIKYMKYLSDNFIFFLFKAPSTSKLEQKLDAIIPSIKIKNTKKKKSISDIFSSTTYTQHMHIMSLPAATAFFLCKIKLSMSSSGSKELNMLRIENTKKLFDILIDDYKLLTNCIEELFINPIQNENKETTKLIDKKEEDSNKSLNNNRSTIYSRKVRRYPYLPYLISNKVSMNHNVYFKALISDMFFGVHEVTTLYGLQITLLKTVKHLENAQVNLNVNYKITQIQPMHNDVLNYLSELSNVVKDCLYTIFLSQPYIHKSPKKYTTKSLVNYFINKCRFVRDYNIFDDSNNKSFTDVKSHKYMTREFYN